MKSTEYVTENEIQTALDEYDWKISASEGRLMLAELLLKAGAGFRNSYTEELFLGHFDLLRNDRTLNARGRRFIRCMFYTHSNRRPEAYTLMQAYRC